MLALKRVTSKKGKRGENVPRIGEETAKLAEGLGKVEGFAAQKTWGTSICGERKKA